MKNISILSGAACILAAFPSVAMAVSVTIAESHATGAYTTTIDTSVLFDPNGGPVTASGSIDLSGLGAGGVLFVGLISKVDYDHHVALPDAHPFFPDFRFFVDTAYAAFQSNAVAGLGQYLQSGETIQAKLNGGSPLASLPTSLEATFGATGMSLTVQGLMTNRDYNFDPDTLTFTSDGSPYTDFSQGAYAFVGTYVGDTTFDIAFDGPGSLTAVPLPAALPLLGSGLGLLGFLAGRRRRSVSGRMPRAGDA